MEKIDRRPWGYFVVLSDTSSHKIKRIVVEPKGKLSLQLHKMRNEHWFVVSGIGKAMIGGNHVIINAGSCLDIPAGTRHRVQNPAAENLVIIEVQTGEYFGEDDIERFEDDYERL
jgi:mannose-6-phosphate isomerase